MNIINEELYFLDRCFFIDEKSRGIVIPISLKENILFEEIKEELSPVELLLNIPLKIKRFYNGELYTTNFIIEQFKKSKYIHIERIIRNSKDRKHVYSRIYLDIKIEDIENGRIRFKYDISQNYLLCSGIELFSEIINKKKQINNFKLSNKLLDNKLLKCRLLKSNENINYESNGNIVKINTNYNGKIEITYYKSLA